MSILRAVRSVAVRLRALLALSLALSAVLSQSPAAISQTAAAKDGSNKAAVDPSDALFGRPGVIALEIEVPPGSAAALQTQPREYVKATMREGGVTYSDVGIHLKGRAGSFRPLTDKPALTIKFDKFNEVHRFHGLKKIHLNNAAQDESYFCEIICGELFRQAGVPATRGVPARVKLNGRDLGLYVLKEGFDKTFLRRDFRNQNGNLYDTGYRLDIDQTLERITGEDPNGDQMLRAAASAAAIADPKRRLEALRGAVDFDRFLSLMAMEVITAHWDGYAMFKNNYRVYADPESGKVVFFPHGMDMMFQRPDCSILPGWDGLIARAIMESEEGRQLYLARVGALFTNVFSVEKLTARINELHAAVKPALTEHNPGAARRHDGAVRDSIGRIAQRGENLKKQLANPEAFATGQHPLFPGLTAGARSRQAILPPQRPAASPGRPVTIKASGASLLPITAASLRGRQIRLEGPAETPNAGYWLDPADHVEWTVIVPKAGKFNVELNYGSAPETGGPFEVVVEKQTLRGKTQSTGNYHQYADLAVGTVALPAGKTTLTVRPGGEFVFGLMNLRGVKLTPVE